MIIEICSKQIKFLGLFFQFIDAVKELDQISYEYHENSFTSLVNLAGSTRLIKTLGIRWPYLYLKHIHERKHTINQ